MKLTTSASFVEFCYDRFRKRKMLGQFKKKTQTVGSNSICLVSKAHGEHRILLLTKGRKNPLCFGNFKREHMD